MVSSVSGSASAISYNPTPQPAVRNEEAAESASEKASEAAKGSDEGSTTVQAAPVDPAKGRNVNMLA